MKDQFDAIIVGGGMVGATLACALAKGGLQVAMLDREDSSVPIAPEYDGRASAIAYGSSQVLRGIGLWSHLHHAASPIWDIRVVDGHVIDGISPLFLHYDHRDIGDAPFGYIIENRETRLALRSLLGESDGVTVIAPAKVIGLHRDKTRSVVSYQPLEATGPGETQKISAPLCIAADGKFSAMRDWVGIKTTGWAYDQTSIVCTVKHAEPHGGVAVELFLPGGPFAMLPMTADRSNIVWSDRSDLAEAYMALDDAAFLAELKQRFGDWLGDVALTGPRFSYPLSLSHAESYVDDRFVLIGDAGHAIHPIAGQGLNMGLRDVAALAEVLVDAKRLGLDLGAVTVLEQYQRWRRFDNVLLAAVTDGLTRLFSNDAPPLRLIRDIGLSVVNKTPPVKKMLMRHAMGVVGELPRLVRGERL